ncbi:unnamed protein product, partial [Polarella glacialis]
SGTAVSSTCSFGSTQRLPRKQQSGDEEAPVTAPRPATGQEDSSIASKSLQALARHRSSNEGAWRAHLQRAAEACEKADAEGAARVLNACSRSPLLSAGDSSAAQQVAQLYAERAGRLLPQSNSRQLATVANALARMMVRDEVLVANLAKELRVKFAKCNTFQASLIANALARLMVVERTLFGQLIPAYAAKHASRFRVKDLALVLNAYAKTQLRSTAVFEALADRCREQAEHMDCHAVSVIANAHARVLVTDERLFRALAWRLRSCSRTCTFQAVAGLANSYAKFGFTSPARPPEAEEAVAALAAQKAYARPSRNLPGSLGITDAVFDTVLGELPRLLGEWSSQSSSAHSTVLLAHAAARAGQHRRRPELPATLAASALRGLRSFEAQQLGMLAVAFAEIWPLGADAARSQEASEASSAGQGHLTRELFWSKLASEAAARNELLSPSDAANCGVAFAAAGLDAEDVLALHLVQHCREEPPPAVASAILVAHAFAGVWDKEALELLSGHIPDMLWQATDAIACRLGLSLWLAGGRVEGELRQSIEAHVVRVAWSLAQPVPPGAASSRGEALELGLESDDSAMRTACQGLAALLAPDLRLNAGSSARLEDAAGTSRLMWLEVRPDLAESFEVRMPPCVPRSSRPAAQSWQPDVAPSPELLEAGQRLALRLSEERPSLGLLLQRLLRARSGDGAEQSTAAASFSSRSAPASTAGQLPPRGCVLSALLLPSATSRRPSHLR